jgi:ABC-type hemin transport system substrate-binding protein
VVELGSLRAEAPDVVLVPSEPYAFKEAHLAELRALAPTVRVDGQDLLWWGARTLGALERLGAQLSSILS